MAMIETINLTKRYGNFVALNGINLVINEGDCFGFIGPNGAGKTTTIKILATLLKPSSGQASIDGLTVGYQNRLIRPMIGYVPDFMGAYDDMVVAEYLEFFAACYNIHGPKRTKIVGDVLELTDLTYKAASDVNSLSRGMQQRLSVARVLLHDPKVLLMDEPASGLDPRARIEMRELLKELKRMGKTILISSHILHELAELCNAVGIIERGDLLYQGTVQDALRKAGMGKSVLVGVADRVEEAAKLLKAVPGIRSITMADQGRVNGVVVSKIDGARVLRLILEDEVLAGISDIPNRLVNAGFRITHFAEEPVSLETAFMKLTKGLVQ